MSPQKHNQLVLEFAYCIEKECFQSRVPEGLFEHYPWRNVHRDYELSVLRSILKDSVEPRELVLHCNFILHAIVSVKVQSIKGNDG